MMRIQDLSCNQMFLNYLIVELKSTEIIEFQNGGLLKNNDLNLRTPNFSVHNSGFHDESGFQVSGM